MISVSLAALREAAGETADHTRSQAEAQLRDRIERVRAEVQDAERAGDADARARLEGKLAQMEQRLGDLRAAGDAAAPRT